MVSALMNKVSIVQEQMNNVQREMEMQKKELK